MAATTQYSSNSMTSLFALGEVPSVVCPESAANQFCWTTPSWSIKKFNIWQPNSCKLYFKLQSLILFYNHQIITTKAILLGCLRASNLQSCSGLLVNSKRSVLTTFSCHSLSLLAEAKANLTKAYRGSRWPVCSQMPSAPLLASALPPSSKKIGAKRQRQCTGKIIF